MEYQSVSLFLIGTEITRGIIADAHGQLLAREMTNLGYSVRSIVSVPDDGTLEHVLQDGLLFSDIMLLTGGLGPTSDDLTRSLVATIAQVPLVRNEEAFEALKQRIGDRIYGANEQQVWFPKGFRVLQNPKGTAPGFAGVVPVEKEGGIAHVLCYAMPGPPVEMHEMFYKLVLPELASLAGRIAATRNEFSCFLLPESKLEDCCKKHAVDGVTWGTRVQEHRISLYLSGGRPEDRLQLIRGLQNDVGAHLVVDGDYEAVDLCIAELAKRNYTICCAESCTGGLLSKLLTDRPGSSGWFWGGIVSYANEAKHALLGVGRSVFDEDGAVSSVCARNMAQGALELSGTDVAISVTGIAGPTGAVPGKPVGTVWFGFSSKFRSSETVCLHLSSYGRESVRKRAAVSALLLAMLYISGDDLLDSVNSWHYI